MAVNTINQLIDLLNQVDVDATVLAAIANDSPTSLANGPSAGLVTTRLGNNVKNVQKVISDIENGITTSVRATIQEEGVDVVEGASDINFVGAAVTVTDVSGVATVTVDSSSFVSKVATPVDNQVGVWTGDGTLEGDVTLTFDGSTLTVGADAGPRIDISDTNNAATLTSQIINPGTPVALMGTTTAHALRLTTNSLARLSIGATGNAAVNSTDTSLATFLVNDEDPDIMLTDITSGSRATMSFDGVTFAFNSDTLAGVASSAIAFNVDGVELWRMANTGELRSSTLTVATLVPAATAGAGARAFVTDANATTFASIVAGGGANGVPVYSDGTDWRIG